MTRKKALAIIATARKGQDFIARKIDLLKRGDSSILTPEYLAKQQADYDKYQSAINRANEVLSA